MSISTDSKGHFDIHTTPSTLLRCHDPAEIFMGGDKNVRSDLIFPNPVVMGLLYVEDGILQKAFLPTKISIFRDRLKTSIVAVYGSYYSLTPIKINHRNILVMPIAYSVVTTTTSTLVSMSEVFFRIRTALFPTPILIYRVGYHSIIA